MESLGARVAGVDEAGRGPLAGPVVAAAVILSAQAEIAGLRDSKALSPPRRESIAEEIRRLCVAWAIGRAEVEEIDSLNILQASLAAMSRAVAALPVCPQLVLVDGPHRPAVDFEVRAIVRGDALVPAISAASILAKVTRDAEMRKLDRDFPGYGFAQHKGYPTRMHLEALESLGVSRVHRRSFGPVQRCLARCST